MYHEPRPLGPGRRTLIFGALPLVLVGALVAFFLVDVLQPPDNCVPGQVRVIGSTAVEPTMRELRTAYAAAVVFAVVMNRSADVSAVTTTQLRDIYSRRRSSPTSNRRRRGRC